MPESEEQHLPHSNLPGTDAEPFSDLEVYNVENLSRGNLHPRLAFAPKLSDRDGLHPYHPRVGKNGDSNGLVVVNEENLRPSASTVAPGKYGFRWLFREWTFQERKVARLALFVFAGVVIGSVVGGVVGSRKSHSSSSGNAATPDSPNQSTISTTRTSSPSPINPTSSGTLSQPTPSWLDAVPTKADVALSVASGSYEVPLNRTVQSQDCFGDPAYSLLWTCQTSPTLRFAISSPVEIAWGGPLDPNDGAHLVYGDQLPELSADQVQLAPYIDIKQPDLGIAMFFSEPFKRMVIIHEDAMPKPGNAQHSIPLSSLLRKGALDPSYGQPVGASDRPYFCYWQSTILEFFAYVNTTTLGNSSTLPPFSENGVTSVPYGGLVKLIEKRKPTDDNVQPYCQHMNPGGKFGPLPGEALVNVTEVHNTAATEENCVCEYLSVYADG